MTDVGVGARRSGRYKEKVYLSAVVEISATMVTAMGYSTSSRVGFFEVGEPASTLRADLST